MKKCPKCKRPAHQFGNGDVCMCIPAEGGCGHVFGKGVYQGKPALDSCGDGDPTEEEDKE